MVEQFLDRMDLERERGITIKAQPVRMLYTARDGKVYQLNLIDTPGHVDFSYEVSRSLAACEGVLLVVDASQGMEAQTIANLHLALEQGLEVIPVINKIDLAISNPDEVRKEVAEYLGISDGIPLLVSAKEGTGVHAVLEKIVECIPPPKGDLNAPLKALIFDSEYDVYRGIVAHIRIFDGKLSHHQEMLFLSTGVHTEALEVGIFTPEYTPTGELKAGEVGYVVTNLKEISGCRVGDTLTEAKRPTSSPLPGFQKVKPMVFCGLYPAQEEDYEKEREALEKLSLNDPSFTYEPERSPVLGFGFRCGFLGLLHMEIVQERLEREFGLDLVATLPNVGLKVILRNGRVQEVENPALLPSGGEILRIEEPYMRVHITAPAEYIGAVMGLMSHRRTDFIKMEYIGPRRILLQYLVPLAEVIVDLSPRLKSVSHGYASLDYVYESHRPSDLVRLDVLVKGKMVDGLCLMVPRDQAYMKGKEVVQRLKEEIPRHLFEVPIQAAIGGRVIARETIPALRKHVTGKCYGGDITRKRKLWEKQRAGKKRMKIIGEVEIPQNAFLSVLRRKENTS